MATDIVGGASAPRISQVRAQFLDHARVELQFRPQTLEKYGYCLKRIERILGDPLVTDITEHEIAELKSEMLKCGNSICWQIVTLAATKRLLQFCRDQLKLV